MNASPGNRVLVLTPPGTGAIALIRVEGSDGEAIVTSVFRTADGCRLAPGALDHGQLRFGRLLDDTETIDDVLISSASDGSSPAIDITTHGGVRIVERVLQVLERGGARLGGMMDSNAVAWPVRNIIEREAVQALVRAKTERAVRFLSWQHRHLPKALTTACELLLTNPKEGRSRLQTAMEGHHSARILLDGLTVALVGPPNSGKSTLFNSLAGRSAAIVSNRSGTTRDWITQDMEQGGLPITLLDTAGIHEARFGLEKWAIQTGLEESERAQVRVLVLDGSRPLSPDAIALVDRYGREKRTVVAINKADVGVAWSPKELAMQHCGHDAGVFSISAATGEGVDSLRNELVARSGYRKWVESNPCLFTVRQAEIVAGLLAADPIIDSSVHSPEGISRLLGHTGRQPSGPDNPS